MVVEAPEQTQMVVQAASQKQMAASQEPMDADDAPQINSQVDATSDDEPLITSPKKQKVPLNVCRRVPAAPVAIADSPPMGQVEDDNVGGGNQQVGGVRSRARRDRPRA
eukprot:1971167-Pyramimonas_sp.AAC.1